MWRSSYFTVLVLVCAQWVQPMNLSEKHPSIFLFTVWKFISISRNYWHSDTKKKCVGSNNITEFMWVREGGKVRKSRTERVKERAKDRVRVTVNSRMIDERLTWLSSQLPASISMTGEPPARRRQTTQQWRKMRILSPISLSHRCLPTLLRLLMCVYVCVWVCLCVCVFLHWEVNQMCVSLSWQAGLWSYACPRVQFREITHSVGDLWRNAQGLEHLYVTCVRACVCVCVGVYARECV